MPTNFVLSNMIVQSTQLDIHKKRK